MVGKVEARLCIVVGSRSLTACLWRLWFIPSSSYSLCFLASTKRATFSVMYFLHVISASTRSLMQCSQSTMDWIWDFDPTEVFASLSCFVKYFIRLRQKWRTQESQPFLFHPWCHGTPEILWSEICPTPFCSTFSCVEQSRGGSLVSSWLFRIVGSLHLNWRIW